MPAEFLRSSSSGQDNEQCHFFFLTWKQRIKRSVKMGINIERLFLNSFLPPPSSHKLESQKSQTFISLSGSITLSRKRGSKSSTFWIISHRRYLGKRGVSEICNGGVGGRLHGLKTGAWGVGRGGGEGEKEINVLPVFCKIHLWKRNRVFFGRTLDNNRLIKKSQKDNSLRPKKVGRWGHVCPSFVRACIDWDFPPSPKGKAKGKNVR